MNIDQAKQLKIELETEFENAIRKYEAVTGCTITDIALRRGKELGSFKSKLYKIEIRSEIITEVLGEYALYFSIDTGSRKS